jgi:hypothetical protein
LLQFSIRFTPGNWSAIELVVILRLPCQNPLHRAGEPVILGNRLVVFTHNRIGQARAL